MTDYLDCDDGLEIVSVMGQRVRDVGLLASALARPQASAFREDAYSSFPAKVASLIDGINRNHPLVDGNKRLSWVCAFIFAQRNGFTLQADVDDAELCIRSVAADELSLDQLTNWVADHLHSTAYQPARYGMATRD